ncbi:hypothetical protein K438DRAFT_1758384 [Mycena galopus ATCC 62051]|nr:hypothetical protein K438DRAFT_1758384 [Mycena galopus ATCC 62051]
MRFPGLRINDDRFILEVIRRGQMRDKFLWMIVRDGKGSRVASYTNECDPWVCGRHNRGQREHSLKCPSPSWGGENEKWFMIQDLIVEKAQKEMIFLGETVSQLDATSLSSYFLINIAPKSGSEDSGPS